GGRPPCASWCRRLGVVRRDGGARPGRMSGRPRGRAAGGEVMMRHPVEVVADRRALMEAGAAAFVAAARAAIGGHGRFVTALSGGSTPRAVFELLATERFASSVDWGRIHVCWGDERAVPPDAEASNYRMAREALLDHVPIPASQVHRIRGE